MPTLLILYALFVFALTVAEYRQDRRAQWFLKPACALGFILIAIQNGALETSYGQIILAALCLCTIGDVALLSRNSQKLFLLGMAFFGLGHIMFTLGFIKYGSSPNAIIGGWNVAASPVAIGIMCIAGAFQIVPQIKPPLKVPAGIYAAIITVMSFAAWLTANQMIMAGALVFAASDFFVGRDRFIAQEPWHALAITPLYFVAQALFALSVAQAL